MLANRIYRERENIIPIIGENSFFYYEDNGRTTNGELSVAPEYKLHQDGYTVLSIEQVNNSISLENVVLDKNKKYAVVLGNEVKGVQQEVVDKCDGCVELPQHGTKHSLNVSVTAGIVIWDFYKQLYSK